MNKDKTKYFLFFFLFLLVLSWIKSVWFISPELHQGNVYRIMYLHVPSAMSAFFCSFLLLVFSVLRFVQKDNAKTRWYLWGLSSAEVGLFFTMLTLFTGSIWGKPTWGTWWTWDARLTTTFVLALLFCAYLLLASSLVPGFRQERVCSVLGILIFVDVPIIYKSVSWWRTLHQPPSMNFDGSPAIDGEILYHLLASIVCMLFVSALLIWQRRNNLNLRVKVESFSQTYLRSKF